MKFNDYDTGNFRNNRLEGRARDRHAEVLVGIHRGVVDANFVVKVRTGAAAAQSNIPNGVASVDILSGDYRITGKMPVAS
jgi:hypothetical protein